MALWNPRKSKVFGEEELAPAPDMAADPGLRPAGSFNRDQLRDAIMGQWGGGTRESLEQFIGSNPSFASGVQVLDKSGRIRTPEGEVLDVGIGMGATGTGKAGWTGVLDRGGKALPPAMSPQTFGASGGVPGAPGAAGTGGASGSVAGMTSGGGAVDPAVRDALLGLMKRSQPGPINPMEDPNLSPQARAYQAARTRGARQQRAEAAERAAFTGENLGGQGSGAFESTLGSIQESAGRDIAGHEAGLVGQEVQARRADLLNALQLASSIGARDQESAIRMQLAQLDEAFRRAELGQRGSIAGQQLGLQGQELAFQRGRWDDQYGLERAHFTADQDRLALLAAMGG